MSTLAALRSVWQLWAGSQLKGLPPRRLLHERQRARSGPSAPPSMTGMTWSAVRSVVAPQSSQRGLAAMVAGARALLLALL
jgi:hypothetical protein